MKRLFLFIFLFSWLGLFAQDTIVTMDGKSYAVSIQDKSHDYITFYLLNDKDKSIRKIPLKFCKKIIPDKQSPIGTNLIIYEGDSLRDFDLLKTWVFILKDHGYNFESIDKDFYFIETKLTKIKGSFNVKFSISVTGNKAIIRTYGVGDTNGLGLLANGMGVGVSSRESTSYRGVKKGSKSNYAYFAYLQGEKISKEFKYKYGGKLIFKTEN